MDPQKTELPNLKYTNSSSYKISEDDNHEEVIPKDFSSSTTSVKYLVIKHSVPLIKELIVQRKHAEALEQILNVCSSGHRESQELNFFHFLDFHFFQSLDKLCRSQPKYRPKYFRLFHVLPSLNTLDKEEVLLHLIFHFTKEEGLNVKSHAAETIVKLMVKSLEPDKKNSIFGHDVISARGNLDNEHILFYPFSVSFVSQLP